MNFPVDVCACMCVCECVCVFVEERRDNEAGYNGGMGLQSKEQNSSHPII